MKDKDASRAWQIVGAVYDRCRHQAVFPYASFGYQSDPRP